MIRWTTRALLAASVVLPLLFAGCSSRGGSGQPSAPPTTVVPSDTTSTPSPALTRHDAHGSATAVGTLVYRRDQGGFFAVTDLVPGHAPSTDARLLAVLVQPDGSRAAPDLVPLVGAYCSFTGTLRTETSISALPELVVESYRVISTPTSP